VEIRDRQLTSVESLVELIPSTKQHLMSTIADCARGFRDDRR
jgi:hypothetical protein